MLIDKTEIRSLIPHAGAMCLLDAVRAWDRERIVCLSATHRDADNPLRRRGRLASVHAFEYGAQAVAVHGGLLAREAGQEAMPGFLAALRDARLHVAYLDDIPDALEAEAGRLTGEHGNVIYAIRVSAGGRRLAEARVTIVMARQGLP